MKWITIFVISLINVNKFTIQAFSLSPRKPSMLPMPLYKSIAYNDNHYHDVNSLYRNNHKIRQSQLICRMSHGSLISADDNWANIAALCTIASVSQSVGERTLVGKLLGAPVTAMAIAFALGSIGVLPPGGSEGCKALQLLSLQLATPLLLIGADVRAAARRCGPLLLAFIIAASSTLVAGIIAIIFSIDLLIPALGPHDSFKIAAALLAKNIGGGINYIAVCQTLGASPMSIAAGLCVDNIFALVYFPITSYLASGRVDVDDWETDESTEIDVTSNILSVENVSRSLAIASIITSLSQRIGGLSSALPVATLLTILFTTFSSQRFARKLRPTGEVLGTSLLYLFFATAGAPGLAIADSVRSSFVPLSVFLLALYGFHGMIIELLRRCFKNALPEVMQPQRLLCASSASIGGPATAAALASSNGWKSLITPSLLVGNLGYAIATFVGILFHSVSRKTLIPNI